MLATTGDFELDSEDVLGSMSASCLTFTYMYSRVYTHTHVLPTEARTTDPTEGAASAVLDLCMAKEIDGRSSNDVAFLVTNRPLLGKHAFYQV